MNSRPAWLLAVTALVAPLGAPAWAQASSVGSASASIYTCIDPQGRKLTSDRPIAACIDREQRELGPSGTVRRVLGPTLTEQERALQQAQQRKDSEERLRQIEERRRERVLTTRYPDKAAHDSERAAAIELVEEVSTAAVKRIAALREQRQALDVEMEFYRKNPAQAPMALRRQLAENEENVQEQLRFLGGQAQEKRRIHQRFDAELLQLQRLWAQQQAAPLPSAGGEAALPSPAR